MYSAQKEHIQKISHINPHVRQGVHKSTFQLTLIKKNCHNHKKTNKVHQVTIPDGYTVLLLQYI